MADKSPVRRLQKGLARLSKGAKNTIEVLREGRMGSPYRAPFDLVIEEKNFRLRHYQAPEGAARSVQQPMLLVPPLMVSSEIYDISPELSAVSWLGSQGIDVWLVDFGVPEQEEGGLERTLDDHVLAVDRCVEHLRSELGQDVHLVGYSQGGMFVYQCAAYRQARGLASVITMGSPVDIWKNLPVPLHSEVTEKLVMLARAPVAAAISELPGLPGALTSTGFKLLSARKELKQFVQLLGVAPDKQALRDAANEPKRRFLNGEGFVAWPGPAFRKFVEDMIVNNRMASGGFVIAGRSVTLADITCPVLFFVGTRDEIAFPHAVRAIRKAAPKAEVHEVPIRAGHFGLVVGSAALGQVWPLVVEWVHWKAGAGPRPRALDPAPSSPPAPEAPPGGEDYEAIQVALEDVAAGGVRGLYDLATEAVDSLWRRMGDVSLEVSEVVDTLRWQLPRLAQLKRVEGDSRISLAAMLSEQAAAIPERTFFLWRGKAYSYREAEARVNQTLCALVASGVKPGDHVGVLMSNSPWYLTAVMALNRLGAVAALLNTGVRGRSLEQALAAAAVDVLICDGEHAAGLAGALPDGKLLVLDRGASPLPSGAVDLESRLDPASEDPPPNVPINQGRGKDLALLMFTSGTTGLPKAARITNQRAILAALGTAACCRLTWRDTVYCCLPLHHATGLLVACGSALAGGARLALAPRFSASTFWEDVRKYGASVAFYVGEICRYLANAPPQPGEARHPLRLLAGNGLRPDVWRRLQERFGDVRVLEFYSATEANVALVNLTGDKVGSIGRAIPGTPEIALVHYDAERGAPIRDGEGRLTHVAPGEPGYLIARISTEHPLSRFEGYLDAAETERKIARDAFEPGDAWFLTGDVLRCDEDGDYWFVDRIGDTYRWKGENVSTEQVAQLLMSAPAVDLCVVYGVQLPGREGRAGMAALKLHDGATLDGEALFRLVAEHLPAASRPRFLRVVSDLEITSTFKFVRSTLREQGADPGKITDPLFYYDEEAARYAPLTPEVFRSLGLAGASPLQRRSRQPPQPGRSHRRRVHRRSGPRPQHHQHQPLAGGHLLLRDAALAQRGPCTEGRELRAGVRVPELVLGRLLAHPEEPLHARRQGRTRGDLPRRHRPDQRLRQLGPRREHPHRQRRDRRRPVDHLEPHLPLGRGDPRQLHQDHPGVPRLGVDPHAAGAGKIRDLRATDAPGGHHQPAPERRGRPRRQHRQRGDAHPRGRRLHQRQAPLPAQRRKLPRQRERAERLRRRRKGRREHRGQELSVGKLHPIGLGLGVDPEGGRPAPGEEAEARRRDVREPVQPPELRRTIRLVDDHRRRPRGAPLPRSASLPCSALAGLPGGPARTAVASGGPRAAGAGLPGGPAVPGAAAPRGAPDPGGPGSASGVAFLGEGAGLGRAGGDDPGTEADRGKQAGQAHGGVVAQTRLARGAERLATRLPPLPRVDRPGRIGQAPAA
jgi:putative long chain acyl-CoA synthase